MRVRSNRVEAQSPRNQFTPQTFAPAPTQTPTPTSAAKIVEATEEVRPLSTATTIPAPLFTPTPLPLLIPIGRPERIVIPSIGVDTAVQNVESAASQIGNQWFGNWQTASYAAGFHNSSALLGQAGNTVISGHNNIEGSVFRDLYQLQPGEIVQVYADGFRYDYIVEDQFIVREQGVPIEQRVQNASWIRTTIDERITLVSCWPPEGNAFRVIVVAKPLSQMAGRGTSDSN
ncbi:MAG: sortase [Caldilineaceae bacterium]|nr:sortase [Caldilineaceae bacterium]